MSKNLALTLLDRGNNGDEILEILNAIVDEFNADTDTEENVDF